MNCPKCGGTGFVPTNVFGVNGAIKCDFCDGTGVFITNAVEPMTNEEWFCQLPTKEKAKWFCDHITCSDGCRFYGKCFGEQEGRELWQEWLKQPHTNKE